MANCKCGSGKKYQSCCEPFIKGTAIPQTPEELLRSRFVAYATQNIKYVEATTHTKKMNQFNYDDALEWSKTAKWDKLEIISFPKENEIEFVAWYQEDGEPVRHHETAQFKKEGDCWFFYDSRFPNTGTVVNESPKVGRNDTCPCGSGKKYKKCCGKK